MEPEHASDSILYMIEEVGEVISVIKKKSVDEMMNNEKIRNHLVEEFADVLMYFSDALNRFKITPEEFSNAYVSKFEKNIARDFNHDHQTFIEVK
jgi:NTP pyrophosphatase (non-canonical NTP hydrolase)